MAARSRSAPPAPARRRFLLAAAGAAVAGAALCRLRPTVAGAAETFEVTHTDAEWRARLTPEQYSVLRQAGTEQPFSSPLDHEKRRGVYACAGCALDLFASETKFDSGTGWPSFWKPLPNAVVEQRDLTYGMLRQEVHCRRCGGHLGHVFDDGPRPTGLRYCIDGVALTFRPAA
ncbi:MAG TPA: peptide-methionine (R)-S-oxide reductase MsrB [Dokdonella sp.]